MLIKNQNIEKMFHSTDDQENAKLKQLFKKVNQKQNMRKSDVINKEIKLNKKIKLLENNINNNSINIEDDVFDDFIKIEKQHETLVEKDPFYNADKT